MAPAMARRSPGAASGAPSPEARNPTPGNPPNAPAQPRAGLEDAVPEVQELDLGHPHDRRGPPLLLLAQRAGLLRRHTGHTGLSAGCEEVVHLLAGRGPRSDGGAENVLDVVGMGDDDQR